MPPSNLQVERGTPSQVGSPVHFTSGPFANRTIRAQLDELQKADLGRKCGNRDRRPLDPPPVVRLKLFEIFDEGMPEQRELEIEDVKGEFIAYGFLCFADLFAWPPPAIAEYPAADARTPSPARSSPTAVTTGSARMRSSASVNEEQTSLPFAAGDAGTSLAELMALHGPDIDSLPVASASRPMPDALITPFQATDQSPSYIDPVSQRMPALIHRMPPSHGNRIAMYVDGIPVPEFASCTQAFVGATFVPTSCFDWEGKATLMSVFSDLAVNLDGTFLMRYRVVNLFGSAFDSRQLPVLAECWGGPFIVYPTKDFPGLAESTELTKYLSRFGVPVNIRQRERKKRNRDSGEKCS